MEFPFFLREYIGTSSVQTSEPSDPRPRLTADHVFPRGAGLRSKFPGPPPFTSGFSLQGKEEEKGKVRKKGFFFIYKREIDL